MTNDRGSKSAKRIKVRKTTNNQNDLEFDLFVDEVCDLIIDSYLTMTPQQRRDWHIKNGDILPDKN